MSGSYHDSRTPEVVTATAAESARQVNDETVSVLLINTINQLRSIKLLLDTTPQMFTAAEPVHWGHSYHEQPETPARPVIASVLTHLALCTMDTYVHTLSALQMHHSVLYTLGRLYGSQTPGYSGFAHNLNLSAHETTIWELYDYISNHTAFCWANFPVSAGNHPELLLVNQLRAMPLTRGSITIATGLICQYPPELVDTQDQALHRCWPMLVTGSAAAHSFDRVQSAFRWHAMYRASLAQVPHWPVVPSEFMMNVRITTAQHASPGFALLHLQTVFNGPARTRLSRTGALYFLQMYTMLYVVTLQDTPQEVDTLLVSLPKRLTLVDRLLSIWSTHFSTRALQMFTVAASIIPRDMQVDIQTPVVQQSILTWALFPYRLHMLHLDGFFAEPPIVADLFPLHEFFTTMEAELALLDTPRGAARYMPEYPGFQLTEHTLIPVDTEGHISTLDINPQRLLHVLDPRYISTYAPIEHSVRQWVQDLQPAVLYAQLRGILFVLRQQLAWHPNCDVAHYVCQVCFHTDHIVGDCPLLSTQVAHYNFLRPAHPTTHTQSIDTHQYTCQPLSAHARRQRRAQDPDRVDPWEQHRAQLLGPPHSPEFIRMWTTIFERRFVLPTGYTHHPFTADWLNQYMVDSQYVPTSAHPPHFTGRAWP